MTKFKNNVLIKNIFILLVSGMIAKVIGMAGKIIYTRQAGVNIVSLYSLITPTFMLIISICQFSFPISISKLAAENKHDNKKLLISAYALGFIINIIVMLFILIFAKTIANLLHNNILYKAIISIIFILPLITVSSIQRGFLHGKENMFPASVTNVTEEIIKIILIITVFPLAVLKSNICAVITIILFNIITEASSIMIMSKAIKKYIKKDKVKMDRKTMIDIIKISLPTTLIRLISSIGFFLEPILLTYVLVKGGYSPNYITLEYGIISSYIVPLLSMPSFFSTGIASALLPNITKAYANKKYQEFNSKLLKLIIISIIVGMACLGLIMIFPDKILEIIYGVSFGVNYIYLIGPFFLILYIQPALSAAIQAMGKTNKLFYVSLTSTILKYGVLFSCGTMGFGMNSLVFSMITGIIVTTVLVLLTVLKETTKKS